MAEKKSSPDNVTLTPAAENATLERRIVEAGEFQRLAERCSDYNDSRSNSRDFRGFEIRSAVIKGEDLDNLEAHYSKWIDCTFEGTKFNRLEGHFAEFINCQFINSSFENSNFSFAVFENVSFINSNLNGADFPFARGSFKCVNCMMERCTAQNGQLKLQLERVNAYRFEANFAQIELEVKESNLRCSEFNDGKVSGSVSETDMSSAEFCRSDISEFKHEMCAVDGMDTRDAEMDSELDEDILKLLSDDDE